MRVAIVIFFLVSLNGLGQSAPTIKIRKTAEDTINYLYMNHFGGFTLVKVEQKSTVLFHNCSKELWFNYPLSLSNGLLGQPGLISDRILKEGDTLVNMLWYSPRYGDCFKDVCGHSDYLWKLRLNQKSNVMIVERVFCDRGEKTKKLYFKVLKFSDYEIILQEMPVKPLSKRYYFRSKNIVRSD